MSSRFKTFPVFLLFLAFMAPWASAAVIDQIAAVVNNRLITQSDIRLQTLFGLEFPLLDEKGKDPHLQFAMDQILFLEDAERFGIEPATDPEIQDQVKEIQDRFGSEENLNRLLAKEGLTREELREMINRYFVSKKFIDQRVNFFIFVMDNEIENYYNDHLADWNGASLDAVRSQIHFLLFEQKRKTKLEDFLIKRRARATIRIIPPYSP